MSISLRQALRLAVGPANVDAAGHAVADWFDGLSYLGATRAADRIREQLQDQPVQPAPDAVPHDRPDTSVRSELMAKLATQREVLLNLCDRVDRLEMRADGLTPIERVQRRWAREAVAKDSSATGGDGPAVSDDREPASVVDEPTDEELLGLDQLEEAWNAQADEANGWNELGLDEIIAWAQRQALARWGHHSPGATKMVGQPAPPAEGEVGELVALILQTSLAWEPDACLLGNMTARQLARAAELLQQRPEPVPVSERLPDPTPEMLASPEFEAVWQCIKAWDIAVPSAYFGYTGAQGNHVRAILDALSSVAIDRADTALAQPVGEGK
jgi:hypothetical protein